jgi:Type I phosphodiesterase / nucleotide pyrophosphatase
MRWLWLVFVIGCAAPKPPPRLVVLVVVDQLPSWSFHGRLGVLRHGFARLRREGTYWPAARYPYAATFTAPGHAALATGAPPAVTGIVANAWFRDGEVFDSTWDPKSPRLVEGTLIGTSPALLEVEGVADRVVARKGKAVGVAVKDRSAILAQGLHPTMAVWFDAMSGVFTTSRWYAETVPTWVTTLSPPEVRGYVWEPLDRALLARHTLVGDDGPGEDFKPGPTFPHAFAEIEEAMKGSPLGVTATRELAEAAIEGEGLGRDDVPDYLSISFGQTDAAGHRYGQESWEAFDMLMRVDRELGVFFDTLDRRVGKDRWAVVLTTDHGAARMVEHTGGRRVTAQEIAAAVGPEVAMIREPYVWLSKPVDDAALDAMVTRVRAIPGIGGAWRSDRVSGQCEARAEPERSVCLSVEPVRAGHIYFTPAGGSIILSKEKDPTTHGSPNHEDVTVPVFVMGRGFGEGKVDHERVSILRIAPTLAALLGVPAPKAAREVPLR